MGERWEPHERERYCYNHCRENLKRRYHLGLTWAEYRRINAMLQNSVRDPIAYSWGKREVLLLMHGGKPTKVIFCPEEGLLITFLPHRAFESFTDDRHAKHRDTKRLKSAKRPVNKRMTPKIFRDSRGKMRDFTEVDVED